MRKSTKWAALAAVSLAACRAPDSVGIGGNASQFDYLGFDQQTFLANQTGMGYGIGVWAEWQLSNQPQPITWEWPQTPPYYLTGDKSPTTVIVPDAQGDSGPTKVQEGVTALRAVDQSSEATRLILLVLGLAVVGGIIFKGWKVQRASK